MAKRFRHRYRIASARAQWWDYGWNGAYYVTICTKDRECIFGDVVGDVPEPYVELSEIGRIAHQYWEEIPDHFPFVELGEFIVMPNHMHGIVIIDRPDNNRNSRCGYVPPTITPPRVETPNLGVSTVHPNQNPNQNPDQNPNQNPNQHPNQNPNQNPDQHPNQNPNRNTDQNSNANAVCPDSNVAPSGDNVAPPNSDTVTPDGNTVRWKPGTLGVIINQYKRKCTIDARVIRKKFGWQSRFHDHIIRDEAEFQRISEYIRNNPSKWKKDRFYGR